MKRLLYLLPLLFSVAFAQQEKKTYGPFGTLITVGVDYVFKPMAYASSVAIVHNASRPNRRIVLAGNISITISNVDSSSYGELWLFRSSGNETITLSPSGKQKGTAPTGSGEEVHIKYFMVNSQMKYEIL